MAKEFRISQEVEFVDVDSMGVMWHGNYARKMEYARCKFLDSLHYGYVCLQELGYFFPVVKMDIEYFYPARYPDTIDISVRVNEARVYVGLVYEMQVKGRRVALGHSRHILVDASKQRALRKIPDDFLNRLLEFKE